MTSRVSRASVALACALAWWGLAFPGRAGASLTPVVTETGRIAFSIDGAGTDADSDTIDVQKPQGATVRKAFFSCASTPGESLVDGDVTLDANPITWSQSVENSDWTNTFADVTAIVKPKLDAAAAGRTSFTVVELHTFQVDGCVLGVVFDDPSQPSDSTVIVEFGGQSTTGDNFAITLGQPLDLVDPSSRADMGLGISFSFQSGTADHVCGTAGDQFSTIDVNSHRLTSCAGGSDDAQGGVSDGSLFTIGGLDDSNDNPSDPFQEAADGKLPRVNDDELYNLKPFVQSGDTLIQVHTVNPSDDDNIFLAYFVTSVPAIVNEGIVIVGPNTVTNPVGTSHTVTAKVVNTIGQPVVGREVDFRITDGPNQGLPGSDTTDANGEATFTYTGHSVGTDHIEASFLDSTDTTRTATATKIWIAGACPDVDPEGEPCDDGNACTTGDTCNSDGACIGDPVECDPSPDPCHQAQCDPDAGCVNVPLTGGDCNDGNACTSNDICQAGACVGTPRVCETSGQCQQGTCNPETGECSVGPRTGGSCDDGDPCTVGDTCTAGTCGGTPLVCTAGSICQSNGACVDGQCVFSFAPDGTACGDGNACNGDEVCQSGVCAVASAAQALACQGSALTGFVSNFESNTVSVVKPDTAAILADIPLGDGPWGVAINPAGTEVWVTQRNGRSVSVIDVAKRTVVATIPVGSTPLGVAIHPNGTRAYVASYDDDHVAVIDTSTRTIITSIPVAAGPSAFAFNAGATRLYVSGFAADVVSVIDPASNTVIGTIPTGKEPLGMALDRARGRLYVANYEGANVTVIGTVSHTVLDTLPAGQHPFGVAADGTRALAYVTNASSDSITVIDGAMLRVTHTIADVGRAPFGVALDLTGGHALVANAGDGTLAIIDAGAFTVASKSPGGKQPIAFGAFVGPVGPSCPEPAPVCSDDDPTTIDTCSPAASCQYAARSPGSTLDALLQTTAETMQDAGAGALGGGKTAGLLSQNLASARSQLTPAISALAADTVHTNAKPPAATRKRLKRINTSLGKFLRTLQKGLKKKTIQRDVGLRLLDLVRAAQSATQAALGGSSVVTPSRSVVVPRPLSVFRSTRPRPPLP